MMKQQGSYMPFSRDTLQLSSTAFKSFSLHLQTMVAKPCSESELFETDFLLPAALPWSVFEKESWEMKIRSGTIWPLIYRVYCHAKILASGMVSVCLTGALNICSNMFKPKHPKNMKKYGDKWTTPLLIARYCKCLHPCPKDRVALQTSLAPLTWTLQGMTLLLTLQHETPRNNAI